MFSWDLATAIFVILALSVSAFFAGWQVSFRHKPALLFVAALGHCLVFSWLFAGKLFWANAIPSSSVVYWANLTPIILGFTAGVSCNTKGLRGWARPLTVGSFLCMAVAFWVMPIARPILNPAIVDPVSQWSDGVCLQSHDSTCAAAAAATLLRMHGIETNEKGMIGPCLTSQQGTEALGLFRGVKIGIQESGKKVSVASPNPSRWFAAGQLPNVALIQFSRDEYASTHSSGRPWFYGHRGEGHAVVVIDYRDGNWIIGDPAVGMTTWTDQELRRRFVGEAIYLEQTGAP